MRCEVIRQQRVKCEEWANLGKRKNIFSHLSTLHIDLCFFLCSSHYCYYSMFQWTRWGEKKKNPQQNKTRKHEDSLYSRGDEGHTDHHQVQNVEIVSTEWTFVQEGSIGCHLYTPQVRRLWIRKHKRPKAQDWFQMQQSTREILFWNKQKKAFSQAEVWTSWSYSVKSLDRHQMCQSLA